MLGLDRSDRLVDIDLYWDSEDKDGVTFFNDHRTQIFADLDDSLEVHDFHNLVRGLWWLCTNISRWGDEVIIMPENLEI